MGLLSIFKRQTDSPRGAVPSAADASDAVQQARTRARQRLIGAAVLLGIGIVGFPLVFETQPRPIPVNIPIEAPPRDGAPALTMPAARTPAASAVATAPAPAPAPAAAPTIEPAPPKPAAAAPAEVITESREEAGREVVAAPAVVAPAPAASKPVVVASAAPKPAAADAARARALLEGKPDKPAEKATDAGRFVVQVGAFADAAAARETRLKVEKLGLKTYTQVASTPGGNRIRVRAGPFASRGEADKALAKARAAGLTAVMLTL
jgi:DedD protein